MSNFSTSAISLFHFFIFLPPFLLSQALHACFVAQRRRQQQQPFTKPFFITFSSHFSPTNNSRPSTMTFSISLSLVRIRRCHDEEMIFSDEHKFFTFPIALASASLRLNLNLIELRNFRLRETSFVLSDVRTQIHEKVTEGLASANKFEIGVKKASRLKVSNDLFAEA